MILGLDAVGEGSAIGPVYAVAFATPYAITNDSKWLSVTDSKKLLEKQRTDLALWLMEDFPIFYWIEKREREYLDANGLSATLADLYSSLVKSAKFFFPDIKDVFLDGNKTYGLQNVTTIVGGDGKIKEISAASIIAKYSRDTEVVRVYYSNPSYQVYGWHKNKGYLTKEHREAIKRFGRSDYHRRSYKF